MGVREDRERRRRTPAFQARVVARWNKLRPIGTRVTYWPFARDGYRFGNPSEHVTMTQAQLLSGHTAVVWLSGVTGCVSVEHCEAYGTTTPKGKELKP